MYLYVDFFIVILSIFVGFISILAIYKMCIMCCKVKKISYVEPVVMVSSV